MTTFSYQWYRDGVAIPGATGLAYVLTADDVGALMTCRETATNGAGSVSADSNTLGPVAALNPDAGITELFANGEKGGWYDPSDLSTMFTDDGVTPVTTDGQAVYRINDKSGRGNHLRQATLSLRPLYKTNGTLHWLQYDGVDDYLLNNNVDLAGTLSLTAGVSIRVLGTSDEGIPLYLLGGTGGQPTMRLRADGLGSFVISNSSTVTRNFSTSLNEDMALLGHSNFTNYHEVFKNGVSQVAVTTSPGTTASQWGTGSDFFMGMTSPNSEFHGRIYGAIVRAGVPTSDQRTAINSWLMSKAGL